MQYLTISRRLQELILPAVRILLYRAGYLHEAPAGGREERRCAWYPDQVDLPLYEPANVRGFFWGPMSGDEEDERGPVHWSEGEREGR